MSMDTTVELQQTDDGELFLEIPDELFDTLGWGDGTLLDWAVVGDSIRISRAVDQTPNYGEELPEQSRVVRTLEGVERSDGADG